MTIYQQELLRKLASMSCAGQIDERDGMLHVSMDGLPLCDQDQNGYLYWQKENLSGEGRERHLRRYGLYPDRSASMFPFMRRLRPWGLKAERNTGGWQNTEG